MANRFNIYVHSDRIESGMQLIALDRGELDDLATIRHTLQSELCFTDPSRSTIAAIRYRTPDGHWLPLEGFGGGGASAAAPRPVGLASPPMPLNSPPSNPIMKAALDGDVSMTLQITTEENILAAKDAVIFEGIARLLLAELLGPHNPSAMGSVERLVHDVRCHAAERPALSTVELLSSAPFARLQQGLSSAILRASATTAGNLGSTCTAVPASAIGAQIAAAAIPSIYRETATRKVAELNEANASANNNNGNNKSFNASTAAAASGSALQAVRSSNAAPPQQLPSAPATPVVVAAPPARNKAAKSSRAAAYDDDDEDPAFAATNTPTPPPQPAAAVSASTNTAANSNYRGAAASLAAAVRRPSDTPAQRSAAATPTPAPTPASALRQSSSYTNYGPVASNTTTTTTTYTNTERERERERERPSQLQHQQQQQPPPPFTANDKITIYCVYSGATSQRAKAIQVPRSNPAFDTVMQTLTLKFGTPDLVLGYICPRTGDCSEVLSNAELKALIDHCDESDSLTLQCWARESVKFDADVIDTEFERRMAAVDFGESGYNDNYTAAAGGGAAAATPARNKAARPTSAASAVRNKSAPRSRGGDSPSRYSAYDGGVTSPARSSGGGYDINANPLAEKPAAWQEYVNGRNKATAASYRNSAPTTPAAGYDSTSASYGHQPQSAIATMQRNKAVNPSAGGGGGRAGSAILEQASARAANQNGYGGYGGGGRQRLTSSALSQYNTSSSGAVGGGPASARGASPMSGRNKSAAPSRAGSRAGGALVSARGAPSAVSRGGASSRYGPRSSRPAFTPSHRLDVSGTAWNEQQLREVFDHFDKDGNGLLDREEMMDYFYTYHDDMGIVDAKNKFVQMLDEIPEFQDGKLTFDEFAVVMLKIAQW